MLIIGHRGASGEYPEHTSRAMRAALAQGADGIECDIRLTKDGHLVCIHDPIVDRVSNGKGRVSTMTLAELEQLDFGDGWPVLTFEELLDIHQEHEGTHLFVETKHPNRYGAKVEQHLAKALSRRGLQSSELIHIISFSIVSLYRAQKLLPNIETTWLHRDWYAPASEKLHRVNAHNYGANIDVMMKNGECAQIAESPVYTYTANTKEQIEAARDIGVSYLATDYPQQARAILRLA
ncbi:glycerophosphodiester phosphodiesterase [Corynebacterium aquilae]|uniref:GP-PDE domain-containing protein n=1 Tax=Corynebacterium aquilae DSM 44791 TaxID=1431546 RepID=A0A1L7CIJ3_9CORY|nr:glycerophosphodiester phosphodiesterase family protein [Corynebacterium aquilae]APT85677.1 hypothetical protein CAQU_12230 [Corynebacterium aquilae DSM 44791]